MPAYTPDDDICAFGGSTTIYGVYYETGTPIWKHLFIDQPVLVDTIDGQEEERVAHKGKSFIGPPPPSLSVQIGRGKGVRIFSQSGTGQIGELEIRPPFMTKSGVVFWQEE